MPLRRALDAARGGGRPLDHRVGEQLGHALGADFRGVRVHTDERADRLSRSLDASAFTVGTDIFFRASQYDPGTWRGGRLLAHELTHVIQQAASIAASSPYGLTPADDPAEREADRAADDVSRHGHAQPPRVIRQAPLIQRKAFIGEDPKAAEQVEFYTRQNPAKGIVQIPNLYRGWGTGERNAQTVVTDEKSRYFRDRDELYAYSRGETEDIGYVDREKTWVRLPPGLLVLGEDHANTTLPDLVEATGAKRYIYEFETTRPSPYLRGEVAAGGIPPHALEERLPKLVVGLVGVHDALKKLEKGERTPGITEKAAPRAEQEYDRSAVEVKLTLAALRELEEAARAGLHHRITAFYKKGPAIRKAIKQLSEGVPVIKTELNQDLLSELIILLKDAAEEEFKASGLTRVTDIKWIGDAEEEGEPGFTRPEKPYQAQYETVPGPQMAGHKMEELRDSYILGRIRWARKNHYNLVGLGFMHLANLAHVLKQEAPDISLMTSGEFYGDQRSRHPHRD